MSRFVALATRSRSALPNLFDLIAFALIFGALVAIVHGSHGMTLPLQAPQATAISLDYSNLPYYALRTTLRMFAAMFASLVFTFTYATWAAKSRRAERFLVPLLDVLQSVPILGFLSFTVTFFLGLFPGSMLGAECAAIFAIFTSQAWNMAFSFYQSLRTVPKELNEVADSFRLSPWQKFWQLETPYAMPGLIWNTMVSMSGGWFFVVASEAISVGNTTVNLPGVGSYLARAISEKRIDAVVAAIITMLAVIIAYDQLLFRPLVTFGSRFRFELSASQEEERSWVVLLFRRTKWLRALTRLPAHAFGAMALWRLDLPIRGKLSPAGAAWKERILDLVSIVIGLAAGIYTLWLFSHFIMTSLKLADIEQALWLTFLTMLRVLALILLASLVWVPVGILVGLNTRLAERVQPLTQFLAAFPANVLFPIVVVVIVRYSLNPDIWLSFLIIFGTQWYILFNVVGGASTFPNDLREAAATFHVRGWDWWTKVMLPAVFPYYVTGALTASGGSWNAAIVAEYVKWGNVTVSAHGIGAYIAKATEAGDYPRIVLGVATMSIFVIVLNRFFWRPLSRFAERRLQLS
ncbi:sulfonate ABC transporter permease [Methylovirgula ligni]|uniref:NitT/TauT family transport system permease protein n=1 Tax=Methylovirgula ligni TaxID=569860 RepID=A0A3D9YNH0_9HYPH|nr:ABC transporter permease subunit [Methylovirgula ligni]QAY96564.1 sulfonate ABC transporter permease [Methylovirgula ligni]REF84130.1 NitT/TauT family transport system permease protein [Methylovirgula ligni]